ncbi:MAG: DegV family protein [Limnochordaceae bacterium]|nr:DegV family protein [Limnochordaceae bacterium]
MGEPSFWVVTDSAADLPVQVAKQWDIHVVPLWVQIGTREYRDGVDLDAPAFYRLITQGDQLPHTTQPSPTDFEQLYRTLSPTRPILSIHLSSQLSGTFQSARLAASSLPELDIHPIDTQSASLGVGLLAVRAARLAQQGTPAAEAEAKVRQWARQLQVVFTVRSLEWLRRNGRIGRAQALVGGLLHVQPVLGLDAGVVAPLEQVRTRARALQRLAELVQSGAGAQPVEVGIVHGDCADEAEQLFRQLQERLTVAASLVTWAGPTIGTHAGPGTIGLIVLPAS